MPPSPTVWPRADGYGAHLRADDLPGRDREVLVGAPRVDVVGAPQVDHQPPIVGAARLLSAAQPRAAAPFAGRPRFPGQLLDADALIGRKASHGPASSLIGCAPRCVPQNVHSVRRSRSILRGALVLFGEAYPTDHTPGVEVAGELALVFVARHQHDDAPLVDVFEV